MVRESDADELCHSVFTTTDGTCVPAVVGVPLIIPLVLIERPLGRPLADHVYGVLPPMAAMLAE